MRNLGLKIFVFVLIVCGNTTTGELIDENAADAQHSYFSYYCSKTPMVSDQSSCKCATIQSLMSSELEGIKLQLKQLQRAVSSLVPSLLVAQELSIIGKPTEQSTTKLEYTPGKAADGILETALYPGYKCSHTDTGALNPWWRVDLGGEHYISKVTILNRGDCCSERLTNAVVRAGPSSTPIDNDVCGSPVTAAQAQPSGGIIVFECDHPLRARYVSVDIPGAATLQLCEVTVEEMLPSQG